MFAKVIPFLRLPYFSISRGKKREISFFDYKVPQKLEEKIRFGQLVKIYFRNKKINGLILGFKKTSKEKKLKSIEKIIFEESLITKNQLKIFKWLSSFYFASLPTILKTSIPQPVKRSSIFCDHFVKKTEDLKISKNFLPQLEKMVNVFIYSKRKKFLLFWDEPFKKLAFYYAVIKKTIIKNQKVLILVPEIDQIQFLLKYLGRLTEKIAILHSKLKKSEIWMNWQKILNGETKIIIGTRMAVFAPIENLGLIILEDEENDLHYSKQFPYYDSRTIAWKITKLNKTRLIFSSQAPRVETYWYTFNQGKFLLFDLRKPVTISKKLKLVDMTEEMRKGNFSPLSDDLEEAIINTIKKGKKVILYLKRKGFATFNFCQDCGYLFSCPRCDLPLVAHKKLSFTKTAEEKKKIYWLICHHCGYEEELPLRCPSCQGVEIKMKGIAIQKIEEIIKEKFQNKDITITTLPFWRNFDNNWAKNVGLIGLVNADVLLHQPDFRSGEKTFQEIISIINWTDYFKIPIIIQTWSKNNNAIENACSSNFKNFYQQELEIRKEFSYPPFKRFFRLTIQEMNFERLRKISQNFSKNIESLKNKDIKVFPYPIPPRRKKIFEISFLIKIKNLHPLSPLPDEVKKTFPQNSFLEPI
ncbi:MAG: hypothetical protein ACK413_01015 [Patescibacteria group bacterium]